MKRVDSVICEKCGKKTVFVVGHRFKGEIKKLCPRCDRLTKNERKQS